MIKHCQTMANIRKRLFTYRHQSNEFIVDKINVYKNNFESHSPLSNTDLIDRMLDLNIDIIASTPITDDEGYRTRLPTEASADSSFNHIDDLSPVCSYQADLICRNEIDDAFF
jgi:hypothetical protein